MVVAGSFFILSNITTIGGYAARVTPHPWVPATLLDQLPSRFYPGDDAWVAGARVQVLIIPVSGRREPLPREERVATSM